MRRFRILLRFCFAFALFGLPVIVHGGPVNPDISVIGDTRALWDDRTEEVELVFEEVEVGFAGPLNPYASAEIYLAIHGVEGIEVEEAKLQLDRYLPAGFGVTAGRALLDFGQLNQVHPHAYPFVDRPLMHTAFFGDDGVLDVIGRLDWIAPLQPVTLRASAGAVRGDLFLGGHHHGEGEHAHEKRADEEDPEEEAAPTLGASGRVELFAEPSRNVSFLVGGSVLHGEHDPHEEAKATWGTVDGKVRFDLGPQRNLILNAEAVLGSLDAAEEAPASDPSGWFAAADLRLDRRWNFGAFAESATERLEDEHRTNRFGGFVGMALMEETTLFRLVARSTDPEEGERSTEILL
ncbi:MAG: hypothetical protein GF346_01020, partial [Candidatus Eisenbacteria bacterium]|nr:hypothetical protein [Candidatus Latescibacterota bacterium]MBD3301014.1 hypothetical protein [Candidatus Eisenbacteria bacterium]